MKHLESNFTGVNNGNIFYQAWVPDESPKALLLIIHGLGEHSGRYMNVVNHFVPKGYGIFALDHFGHGRSDGTREYVEDFSNFTDNINRLFNIIMETYPALPVFLVGHSMGGLISSFYLVEHQNDFKAAVISGAAVKIPDNISPITISIGKVLSIILPKLGLIGLEVDAISRDPKVVEAYINDPLTFKGKTTARLAAEMLKAMKFVNSEMGKINLPLYIVHGGADKLVPKEASQLLFEGISSADKTIKIYDGYYHEVFNEPEHAKVLAEISDWVEKHL